MSFRLDAEKGGLTRNVEDEETAGKEPKVELICPVCIECAEEQRSQGSTVERHVKWFRVLLDDCGQEC